VPLPTPIPVPVMPPSSPPYDDDITNSEPNPLPIRHELKDHPIRRTAQTAVPFRRMNEFTERKTLANIPYYKHDLKADQPDNAAYVDKTMSTSILYKVFALIQLIILTIIW
jgi:hypothetical protein